MVHILGVFIYLTKTDITLLQVPKSSVDLAIRSWPHILGCSATKMKSMVEQFNEFGVKKKMLVPVITYL